MTGSVARQPMSWLLLRAACVPELASAAGGGDQVALLRASEEMFGVVVAHLHLRLSDLERVAALAVCDRAVLSEDAVGVERYPCSRADQAHSSIERPTELPEGEIASVAAGEP